MCVCALWARAFEMKTLGCQRSRLQLELGIVGDVTTMENNKKSKKLSGALVMQNSLKRYLGKNIAILNSVSSIAAVLGLLRLRSAGVRVLKRGF